MKKAVLLKRTVKIGLLSVLLLTQGCISWVTPKVQSSLIELEQGEYQLDTNHAAVLFKVGHLGLSTYVGRFNQFDAQLSFSPQDMSQASLSATVNIDSLDINNDDLTDTLMGSSWFDQKQFPQAVFTSQSVIPISDTEFQFYGTLTLRGISKPVSFNAIFHGGADNWMTGKYTLGFSATSTFKRSDFDMGSYIPLIGDDIDIEIYAEFLKQSSPTN
ncbi:YceI family protein [Shewanella intestini]|uniref:Polyisoprenoid-binding protein n=1 Tax=Shewanella intestini TaxID=2017544 RepID=A0ABS5HXT2_9GAMM|nr:MULTISPECIES: YceI family protein [Shewanella]MBR9726572.1 polyisoprenoid-binding protein [Shewanella intestini]MRG34862.1 polyisoprenoid-binding protein [Shewanella sp. XMDDZSB0408]